MECLALVDMKPRIVWDATQHMQYFKVLQYLKGKRAWYETC